MLVTEDTLTQLISQFRANVQETLKEIYAVNVNKDLLSSQTTQAASNAKLASAFSSR